MTFEGISVRFSAAKEKQHEEILKLWDYAAKRYGRDTLRGLGYNCGSESLEYVIARKDGDIDLQEFQNTYPQAKKKKVLLPEKGWYTFTGKTKEFSKLYSRIYADGPLTYEIETFDEAGNCEITITREYPEICQIKMEKIDEIMELYQEAKSREYCFWNEEYPSRADIEGDIVNGDLYGIQDDEGTFIAAIAKDRDEDIDSLPCWQIASAAELARLVISREYVNQGLARILIRGMADVLVKRGFKGIHYLVAEENIPAVSSYKKLAFNKVGEVDLFGAHYLCYEKLIENMN